MAILKGDGVEFSASYYSLRVGLVVSALTLLVAVVVRGLQSGWQTSISDFWYTPVQFVFVLCLATAGVGLIATRGDTITEDTLLNVAGWLALIVATVPSKCAPDDECKTLAADFFKDNVAPRIVFAAWAILIVGFLGCLTAVIRVLMNWNAMKGDKPRRRFLLFACAPAAIAVGFFGWRLATDSDGFAHSAHGWAAVPMFVLLALVASSKTRWILLLLKNLGDDPAAADDPKAEPTGGVSTTRLTDQSKGKKYDAAYFTIAAVMVIAVFVGFAQTQPWGLDPHVELGVEFTLLIAFGVFWSLQTIEAFRASD